jgi:hypothetical protein
MATTAGHPIMMIAEAMDTMMKEPTATTGEDQDTMISTLAAVVDMRMKDITGEEGRIMERTGKPVENKTDMIVTKGFQATVEDTTTGASSQETGKAGPGPAVIGIREAVATERLRKTTGITPVTRRIILMNGITRAVSATHPINRWSRMMVVVRRQAHGEDREAVPQVRMMKDCASYLRINSRICTGLKKQSLKPSRK